MARNLTHTPWSDTIDLITYDRTQNARGYPAEPVQGARELRRRRLFCSFEDGVSQSEFYLSQKEGMRADAQAEIWTVDYEGEQYAEFAGGFRGTARLYRVIRAFPQSFDTTTLILSEVVRS